MRFDIRDANKRTRLDRQYLENMKFKTNGCPKCGKYDYLKIKYDMDVNVSIYADYKIICTDCGYEQNDWYDTVVEALKAL